MAAWRRYGPGGAPLGSAPNAASTRTSPSAISAAIPARPVLVLEEDEPAAGPVPSRSRRESWRRRSARRAWASAASGISATRSRASRMASAQSSRRTSESPLVAL